MTSHDALLAELEPTAARLLDRHLASAKEWFPHEIVPWSQGRDFEPGYEWSPDEVQLTPEVRSALFVNLLTEDNLPYYFRTIESMFGRDSAWGTWSRRWTAEEGRHSIVIRDYLTVTRAIDPVHLERARMAQVECGEVPEPETPHDGFAYVALQELATRIAHHNTGKLLDDKAGYEVMKRVASDENRHHLFYRDMVTAALEVDPSGMVCALERQVRTFEMPGTGILDFEQHAKAIARPGSTTS
jgi:acyl-[acyl-carrier-protein] desaturase